MFEEGGEEEETDELVGQVRLAEGADAACPAAGRRERDGLGRHVHSRRQVRGASGLRGWQGLQTLVH